MNVQGDSRASLIAPSGQLVYRFDNHYWMPGYQHHSWNGRFDYEHKTRRKGERFTLSYMLALTRQHTNQENTYTGIVNAPFPYSGIMMTERERFTEHTFQADWLRPLGKGHQLEIGTKYIIRFLDYDDGIDSHDIMINCVWQVNASQAGQTTINWNGQTGTISFVAGIKWLYPAKGAEELICVEEGSNEVIGEVLPE